MGLIEKYEPDDIKIEHIETQRVKKGTYSGEEKLTNGKGHQTPTESNGIKIHIPGPKLGPEELFEPRKTFSPAKVAK
jgi:hypothetical protein